MRDYSYWISTNYCIGLDGTVAGRKMDPGRAHVKSFARMVDVPNRCRAFWCGEIWGFGDDMLRVKAGG